MATAALKRRRVLTFTWLALAIGCAMAPLVLASGQEWVRWWVAVIWPLSPIAVAASCFRVSQRLTGHEHKAWICFGLGCLVYGIGEINWSIYDMLRGVSAPLTTVGDLGYFCFPLLYILGIWYYRTPTRSTGATFVQAGNLGVTFASIVLAYLILFHQLLRSAPDAKLSAVVVLLGILSVSAVFFALINVLLYLWGSRRAVMIFILIGLSIYSATDIHLTYAVLKNEYAATNLDSVLYLVSYAMLYWSGFEQTLVQEREVTDGIDPAAEERGKRWATLLPPIAVAGVLVIAVVFRARLDMELLPLAAGGLALFVVSLAVQSWWGFQVESRLRIQAQTSEANLQHVNRRLQTSIERRAQVEEELRKSQRMEAIGNLTSGVAHDFNNLLAVIVGNLELARKNPRSEADVQEFLDEALSAADRGSALTQSLLSFSRIQALSPQTTDVGALLQRLRGMLERTLSERIEIEIDVVEDPWKCMADQSQIENAILNLATNARDAMPGGGRLTIEISNVTLDEPYVAIHPDARVGSFVMIAVRDTGAGIAPDVLPRVFEPFFTTKELGAGTGLGLSMVYGFAIQSQGHVTIESKEGSGTAVRLYLPRSTVELQHSNSGEQTDPPRGRSESVLVVEDSTPVRKLTVRLLKKLGYAVSMAANGAEALAALDSADRFDLILSDVVLPGGISGVDLVTEAVQRRPGLKILLMSGYARDPVDANGQLRSGVRFLSKPFRMDELARAVRSALED